MKRLLSLGTILAGISLAQTAQAVTITSASDFIVNWSIGADTATAHFSSFDFSAANKVSFVLQLSNTTTTGSDKLTAVGWVTNPSTVSVTDSSSTFASNPNVKLGSTNLSDCIYSGSNCNSGNGGLAPGSSTANFNVTVGFGTLASPLDFSGFAAKIGNASGFGSIAAAPVPEPLSIAVLGIGMVGIGVARRRRA